MNHPANPAHRYNKTRWCLSALLTAGLWACSEPAQENTPPPSQKPAPALLQRVDNTEMGIDFVHDAGFSDKYSIYEPLGSGVATLDLDNDGWWDLFFPQYGGKGTGSRLYRNQHGKRFVDITKQSGIGSLNGLIFAAAADADNDGLTDLLTGGENRLLLLANQGNGRFADTGTLSSPAGEQFFTGASWFDGDGDGRLDVWITNYVDGSRYVECRLPSGRPGYCSPSVYPDRVDLLLRNHGSFRFLPWPELNIPPRASLGVVATDFDNNGWPDIYVANDGQPNQLYLNNNGRFGPDEALRRGAALNLMGETEASMGVAVGDIDGNGFPDLYLTHYRNETNTIYYNHQGTFNDQTARTGLAAAVRPMTGFGTVFTDLDGDNRLDIVVVNGSVVTLEDTPHSGRLNAEPVQIWLHHDTGFTYLHDLADQLPHRVGRGLVAVDWDNDGDKDLVISNNNQPPTLLRNESNPRYWLGLDLRCHQQPAIGTKVTLRQAGGQIYHRHVHTDGSYASSGDPRVLFYRLAPDDQLHIHWPDGQTQEITVKSLSQNRYLRLFCPETNEQKP